MSADSHRDLIVAAIRVSSQPLDDDQLAARTGISPRQRVNQVCRALERAGMVRRGPGPDGKIVNEWLGEPGREPATTPSLAGTAAGGADAPAGPAVTSAGAEPAGDSAEQRGAERVMLDLLGAQLGRELNPDTITVPSGERVEVDGADAGRTVLAECWAHQGPPKSAQKAQGPGRCLQAGLDWHHRLPAAAAHRVPERPAGRSAVPARREVVGLSRPPGQPHRGPRRQPPRRPAPSSSSSTAPPLPLTPDRVLKGVTAGGRDAYGLTPEPPDWRALEGEPGEQSGHT